MSQSDLRRPANSIPGGGEQDDLQETFGFSQTTSPQYLERILRLAARQTSFPIALLLVPANGDWRPAAVWGIDAGDAHRLAGPCSRISLQGDMIVIPDTRRDSRFRPTAKVPTRIGSFVGMPLKAPDGRTTGVLCLLGRKPHALLTQIERDLLRGLGALLTDMSGPPSQYAADTGLQSDSGKGHLAKRRPSVTEEQLRSVVRQIPVGVAVVNRKMEYIAVSNSWCDACGMSAEEVIGRSHYDVFPEIPESWKAEHRRALRGESLNCGQASLKGANGFVHRIFRILRPWFDEHGRVGGLILFNDVITDQKRIADELERSQKFLKAVLESVQDGIVACDEKGRLTVSNGAAKRMLKADLLKIPPEEWAAKYHIYEADGKTPLRTERLPLVRALRGEIVSNERLTLLPDKRRPRQIVCNARRLDVRGGVSIGAVVSIHDITDQIEIEARYQQSQKMEAIGQLTGGLAHDFNNLLAVILGNLQLVQAALTDKDKSAHRLAAAIRAAQRGADLTDHLLAFARKQPLEAKQINANKLIIGLKELFSRTLGESVRMETALRKDLWPIHADETQLQAALLNLAINARDAMENGGRLKIETRNISLKTAYTSGQLDLPAGDYAVIAVSDSGCGMSRDIQSRAFEPFFTTKGVGKGTGLGLSTVYGFITQSRGYIEIESEEGSGTTIRMYFPRSRKPVSREDEIPVPEEAPVGGKGHLLVVEDDSAVREVVVAQLEDAGYEVTEAKDGRDALKVLESRPDHFDLLLTDVVMPGTPSGPALADIVRQKFPGLKILFMSGYANAFGSSGGNTVAGIHLIRKPYRQEELTQKVRELLDRTET